MSQYRFIALNLVERSTFAITTAAVIICNFVRIAGIARFGLFNLKENKFNTYLKLNLQRRTTEPKTKIINPYLHPVNIVQPVVLAFGVIFLEMIVSFGIKVALLHLLFHVKRSDLNLAIELSRRFFLT